MKNINNNLANLARLSNSLPIEIRNPINNKMLLQVLTSLRISNFLLFYIMLTQTVLIWHRFHVGS